MHAHERWYLICYDIHQVKRLQKVQRLLRKKAFMLQESVYLFSGDDLSTTELRSNLVKCIRIHEDDLRVYQLNPQSSFEFYPHSPWSNHLYISDMPKFTVTPVDPGASNGSILK